MSSTLRTVAQIPARIKYLIAVRDSTDDSDNPLSADCQAFTVSAGTFAESSVVASNVLPLVTVEAFSAGDLFKDLGRQVTIYDPTTKLHQAIFREVQLVDGIGSNGVSENTYATPGWNCLYMKVWSADGQGVFVARTGPGA